MKSYPINQISDRVTTKILFPHQQEAISRLVDTYRDDDQNTKSGLLVLPTGGGKTLTTVRWIMDNVLPKNIKVIWLAHSFHLLDQALETFEKELPRLKGRRETLNIRIVSSHPSHDRVETIKITDDVLIMTSPTAISALNGFVETMTGDKLKSPFYKFMDGLRRDRLLVVLDEAHHAPAFGCRNLLLELKKMIPKLWLLGLTATPTYTDKTRRGWLGVIFEQGIIHETKKDELQMLNILARENYISKKTPVEMEVDDALYDRLVRQHKDLPESLIEILAENSVRNDFIVQDYLANRQFYGKTIMFVDRWVQCRYLMDKLIKNGVRADSVFTFSGSQGDTPEERNLNRNEENKRIIERFKKDELDVLINIKMLTEGTDIPNTRTVFITRDTTSSILLTQMIGRALRGEKAGGGLGKKEAHIVFFSDNWKRMINWATNLEGGTDEGKNFTSRYPIELISIALVDRLVSQMDSGAVFQEHPFLEYIPIGWYEVEFVMDVSEGTTEEMQSFKEYVLIYGHTRDKFDRLIEDNLKELAPEWSQEKLVDDWLQNHAESFVRKYFNALEDDLGNSLTDSVIKILRHIGQNQERPKFISFDIRDQLDLDKIAEELMHLNTFECIQQLKVIFNDPQKRWRDFFKTFDRFRTAAQASMARLVEIQMNGYDENLVIPIQVAATVERPDRELSNEEKALVLQRDNNKCLCCGLSKAEARLQVDHIIPYANGGQSSINNSQTLCKVCNNRKSNHRIIDFRKTATELRLPRQFEPLAVEYRHLYDFNKIRAATIRAINFFYSCNAVYDLRTNERKNGAYYSHWEVILNPGNDPAWLLNEMDTLLEYVRKDLIQEQIENIEVRSL